jgi:hypothetical protein
MDTTKLEAFLNYKAKKLNFLSTLESRRLDDLKNGRETIFKYALPSSIIDGVGGAIATAVTGNFLVLIPVLLLMIVIYILAVELDLQKYSERQEIVKHTEDWLYKIALQEASLRDGS